MTERSTWSKTDLKGCWDDFSLLAQRCSDSVEVFVSDLCVQLLGWVELQLLALCEQIFAALALFFLCELLRRQLDITCGSEGEETRFRRWNNKCESWTNVNKRFCFDRLWFHRSHRWDPRKWAAWPGEWGGRRCGRGGAESRTQAESDSGCQQTPSSSSASCWLHAEDKQSISLTRKLTHPNPCTWHISKSLTTKCFHLFHTHPCTFSFTINLWNGAIQCLKIDEAFSCVIKARLVVF